MTPLTNKNKSIAAIEIFGVNKLDRIVYDGGI